MAAARAGFGTRRLRCPSGRRRCGVVVLFLWRRTRRSFGRHVVDGRSRWHGRHGGGRRIRLRFGRLVVRFLRARPTEFSPQCVVAVGHLHISFALRRRLCRPPSSINYSWAASRNPATRVRRGRPANTLWPHSGVPCAWQHLSNAAAHGRHMAGRPRQALGCGVPSSISFATSLHIPREQAKADVLRDC